jgi:Lrp/AsnC family transcriptional regulator, leucine-responsive regulatory protein
LYGVPVALGLPMASDVRMLDKYPTLPRWRSRFLKSWNVTGEDCFLLKVYIPAIDQLDRLLDRFLFYGATTTTIIQSSPVPLRPPPLPDDSLLE